MQVCWKCGEKAADGISRCPSCSAPLGRMAVDQMATIGPGGSPSSQVVPGVLINDRYEIKSELGRGGMGIVYLAFDRTMDIEVAIKVIPQELCLDPNAVTALKREAAIALKLTHENIVRLFNLETWEGQAFVVMEYVGGGTLSHLRSDHGGTLTLDQALPYLSKIAAALDYSHSSIPAVIHRDLKPLNILLTDAGAIKVADFGLARVMRDSATRISGHESAGTLAYMAPEQIRGKGIGKATDVYAFAAIIYELLSGNPPFYTGDLRWQILHEEVEPIAGVPDYVNSVLQAALAKEREERPESAGELVLLLRDEKQGKKIKSGRKKPDAQKQHTVHQKRSSGFSRIFIGGFALLMLTALAVGGWYYAGGGAGQVLRGAEPILTVASEPEGAVVFVDAGEVGPAPITIERLDDGPHEITVKLGSYVEYSKNIYIQQGKPVHLVAQLSAEPFGDLQIESTPSGASIFIDGKKRAETPASISRLEAGERLVEVSKEGYEKWLRKLDIRPLNTTRVKASLISSYGQLEVTSNPGGAEVYIDGKREGRTPVTITKIRKGEHTLRLVKEKYIEWQSPVVVKSSEPVSIYATLKFGLGGLLIKSTPQGSMVRVNGSKAGKTPLQLSELQPGWFDILITQAGYKDGTARVEVRPDVIVPVEVALIEEPKTGKLTVRAVPVDATVRILNIKSVYSPGMDLKDGRYHIEVSAEGYEKEKRWIELAAGDEIEISFRLKQDQVASVGTDTVLRNKNGLMWAVSHAGNGMTYLEADNFKKSCREGGYSDWRLPTLEELSRLYKSGGWRFGEVPGEGIVLQRTGVWASGGSQYLAHYFDFQKGENGGSIPDPEGGRQVLLVR